MSDISEARKKELEKIERCRKRQSLREDLMVPVRINANTTILIPLGEDPEPYIVRYLKRREVRRDNLKKL